MRGVRVTEALSWMRSAGPFDGSRWLPLALALVRGPRRLRRRARPAPPSRPRPPRPRPRRPPAPSSPPSCATGPPSSRGRPGRLRRRRASATASRSARPGYLTREQLFDVPDIFLWPGESSYIHELAYWEFDDGTFRTIRWTARFTITLDADIADDPAIVAKANEVAAEVSRHIGFPVRVGAGRRGDHRRRRVARGRGRRRARPR